MIYLLLSILSSSLIFVIFKLYTVYGINTLQAIIYNYFIACSVGLFLNGQSAELARIPQEAWFPGTLILGLLFISVFYLAALTTQRNGLSVVSVASKMSLAIPVLFGIFFFRESAGIIKVMGIVLALAAVFLTSIKKKDSLEIEKKNLLFPLLVFLGSGTIDTGIKYLETSYVAREDVAVFSSTIFAVAGSIGVCVLIFQGIRGKLRISFRNVLGGILLGVPNFFSIYFLVLALRTEGFESSTIFPLNNVSIVLVSTLLGILLFKERLISKNWLGIVLAIGSILMIANA